jgi:circadian clock protein KaiC
MRLIDRADTGVPALDHVLEGGFPRNRLYLLEGDPGTGKTTMALHFLLAGVTRGEVALYVTLSETGDELRTSAAAHGWNLDGIHIHEFLVEGTLAHDSQYTVFQPAEVELGNTMSGLFEIVERVKPARVVIDSLAEMRLLARDALRYRRQILSLKQFFHGRGATVLLLDDRTFESADRQLHSIAHGVVRLEQLSREYGPSRRRLQILKIRGSTYREGLHDFVIRQSGIVLFPRLVATQAGASFEPEVFESGVPGLDAMLGGGLKTGTATLIMGPAGVGKTIVASHYAVAAARAGKRATLFVFDEERQTLLDTTDGLGVALRAEIDRGAVTLRTVNPAELSPGEFAHLVCAAVEEDGAQVVVIDSLNGYLAAMPEENMLNSHLRELFSYLRQHGVLTLVTMAMHGLLGPMQVNADVSYLADTVLLLRFFEQEATLRRAISVVKRRGHAHDTRVRELKIAGGGVAIDDVAGLHGILTGVPQIREQLA